MRKEPIIILRELLVTQMNHWILFFADVALVGLVDAREPVLWKWGVCSLIPFAFFAVRRYTDRFLVYLASHIAVIAASGLIPCESITERLLYYALAVGYAVCSVYLRVSRKDRLDVALPVVVPVLSAGVCMLLLGHYRQGFSWEMYFVIPLIIFFGLNFMRIYFDRYLQFLAVNQSSTGHIPMKEMFRSGFSQVLLLSVGMSGILLLTADIGWVGQIASMLKRILIPVLRWLLRGKGDSEEPDIVLSETPDHAQGSDAPSMVSGGSSVFWQVVEKVFLFAAGAAFVGFILFLLYLLVRYLYRIFSRRSETAAEESLYTSEIREKCEVELKSRERSFLFGSLSVRERIRRLYKREIWAARWQLKAGKDPTKLGRMTARECAEVLGRKELASVYEKARYSDEECTPEDIRRAKQ